MSETGRGGSGPRGGDVGGSLWQSGPGREWTRDAVKSLGSVLGIFGLELTDRDRFIVHARDEFDGIAMFEIGDFEDLRRDANDKRVSALPDSPRSVGDTLLGVELNPFSHVVPCILYGHESYLCKTVCVGYK